MPRACVIVLDAVGAGELPDAAEYGDEGSDTLGNVARAVGGLDLPTLEALGLGNVEPLSRAARRSPARPRSPAGWSSARRARTRRPGHWELMGIVTPDAVSDLPARLSARRDRPVHAPHGPRRAREQAGVGHGDHPGARRGAPEDRQVDRLHVGGLRLPDRGARGHGPARGAVRGLAGPPARS